MDDARRLFRRGIDRADVVFALDEAADRWTVVYGKRIVGEALRDRTAVHNWVAVPYRPGTADFAQVLELVAEIKGSHEWSGEG
ncbi:MAG: hypothetical protein KJ000_12435 [Pirellulaceae bacterium]|nr:hypothetical protein [Pirellulaceae bacterium]